MDIKQRMEKIQDIKIRYDAAYTSYYDSIGKERIEALNNFLDIQRQLGTMAPELIDTALIMQGLLNKAVDGLEFYAERVDDEHSDVAKRIIAEIKRGLERYDGICSI